MPKHPFDHDHASAGSARAERYSYLDRVKSGEGGHPKVKMLDRRRKGRTDATMVKQYLRIQRGYLA